MRTFIAVEISEEQKKKLQEFQEALKKCGADLNLVERENLHLTLRFLGEITEGELEKAKKGLERAANGEKRFLTAINGTGVFPNLNYVKVIWAGVEKGKEELERIAEKINNEINVGQKNERRSRARREMLEAKRRAFSAHITVARVKSAKNLEDLKKVLKEFQNFEFGETIVSEIKIKESKLSPRGPIYSDLCKIPLEP